MAGRHTTEWRIRRLRALLEHPDFGNVKAALGRALGFTGGAYVRQMLDGERPITEKLIEKVETMQGGRYACWFDEPDLSDAARQLAAKFDDLLPEAFRATAYASMVAQLEQIARLAQAAGATTSPDPAPTERPPTGKRTLLA